MQGCTPSWSAKPSCGRPTRAGRFAICSGELSNPNVSLRAPLRQQFDEVNSDWRPLLQRFADSAAGSTLCTSIDARVAAGEVVFPPRVLRAFELTPLSETRVVILGQDPYHGAGQAEGLAFSVPPGQRLPPSLRNIVRELERDLGLSAPASGTLVRWARHGVLLLNSALTVEQARPGAHAGFGWHVLTDAVIQAAWEDARPKVFMRWGAQAQARPPRIQPLAGHRHLLLQCNHPSPLSATRGPTPFAGCGHFGQASRFLRAAGQGSWDWALA
ncbi:MAG: uracil-DNA glycosylase [Chitinophagaceae bacterium]|nr:uracil-DNA glycosylase [Rubrivivax sp.]